MSALPTVRLSEFLHLVLPQAKHCPEPFALLQLRLAAIEFCERTRCWRYVVTKELTVNSSVLLSPITATIHEFEEATLNGLPLEPTQFSDIPADEITGEVALGQAKWITQSAPGEVSIYPFETGTLRVSCFLKPRHGQVFGTDSEDPMFDAYNVVPDFMLAQHATAIADGALRRILMTPDEPFTDPQRAVVHAAEFDGACRAHFSSNMRGQQRAPVRVKPRWM